jgi:hypothetical protein
MIIKVKERTVCLVYVRYMKINFFKKTNVILSYEKNANYYKYKSSFINKFNLHG